MNFNSQGVCMQLLVGPKLKKLKEFDSINPRV